MSQILCPWVIPYSAWTGYGISRDKISRYHALDPAAWLKNEETTSGSHGKTVLIRLEESKASYIADSKLGSSLLIDAAVDEFSKHAGVTILCRYSDQIEYAKERYGSRARIIENVVDGVSLIKSAGLFIGAGGTMSAEAALLGVPTISIAPVRFYVDDYLSKSGLVARARNPDILRKTGNRMLKDARFRETNRKRAVRALASMEDPTDRIIKAITGNKGAGTR
jgi:hypothetical protein